MGRPVGSTHREALGKEVKNSRPKRRQKPASQIKKTVTGLGRAMASTLDLKIIFQELAKGIKSRIRHDRIAIYKIHKRDDAHRVFLAPPRHEITGPGAPIDQEEKRISERVARGKKPLIWKDMRSEKGNGLQALSRVGLRSYVGLPLIHRGRVLGSLHLANKRPQAYGSAEVRFLLSVGEWLALAMDNAHSYEKIKRRNEELEMGTEYKSQFLARMSHEIRTPLGVLIGFLDILHSGTLGPVNQEQKTALDKMQAQSHRLQKLINDVLNLSRIEEGTTPLEISTFALEIIIEPLRTLVDNLQRESQLKVLWDIEPNLPMLTSDAPKLEEILQNLIVNAFKYTPEGEVRIRIKNHSEAKSVEFVVEDTGLGISLQNIPKIFEGFHQIDFTTSSRGVGLGLTIVKKYIELIDGDIEVQTLPGEGSSFKVTLPYILEAEKAHPSVGRAQ